MTEYWQLQHTDGRKLNVDLDMRNGITTMWLDRGGCSPCFQTETAAQSYLEAYVRTSHHSVILAGFAIGETDSIYPILIKAETSPHRPSLLKEHNDKDA